MIIAWQNRRLIGTMSAGPETDTPAAPVSGPDAPTARQRLVEAIRDGSAERDAGPGYSRFVGLMKLVLPLGALVLSGLVVMWPYLSGRDDGFSVDFTDLGIDESDTIYMTKARYFGTDANSQPYTITADSVVQIPEAPGSYTLDSPKADVLLNSGDWLALAAKGGILNREKDTLLLRDEVSIYSDQGYEFHTEKARIDLRTHDADGNAKVEGQGPLGILNADGFRIRNRGDSLFFLGHVRLILYPGAGA